MVHNMVRTALSTHFIYIGAIFGLLLFGLLSVSGSSTLAGTSESPTPESLCHVSSLPEEKVYYTRPPDTTTVSGNPGVPPYRATHNRFGFREEELPEDVSNETVVIAVVGDSFTYGEGLNSSYYVDQLEWRLKTEVDRNISVINLGVPGAGMRDYYQIAQQIGLKYSPDILIVSIRYSDTLSRRRMEKIETEMISDLPQNYTEEELRSNLGDRIRKFLRESEWEDSEFKIYGNRLQKLAQRENIPLLFFAYDPLEEAPQKTYIYENGENMALKWAETCNITLVRAPERMRGTPREEYSFEDGHYDTRGHTWLADKLYNVLKPRIKRIQ